MKALESGGGGQPDMFAGIDKIVEQGFRLDLVNLSRRYREALTEPDLTAFAGIMQDWLVMHHLIDDDFRVPRLELVSSGDRNRLRRGYIPLFLPMGYGTLTGAVNAIVLHGGLDPFTTKPAGSLISQRVNPDGWYLFEVSPDKNTNYSASSAGISVANTLDLWTFANLINHDLVSSSNSFLDEKGSTEIQASTILPTQISETAAPNGTVLYAQTILNGQENPYFLVSQIARGPISNRNVIYIPDGDQPNHFNPDDLGGNGGGGRRRTRGPVGPRDLVHAK